MIEQMQKAYGTAMAQVHSHLTDNGGAACMTQRQKQQVATLRDPMAEMESELDRIRSMLAHKAVKPDIAGWRPQPAKPAQQQPPRDVSPPVRFAQPRLLGFAAGNAYPTRSGSPSKASPGGKNKIQTSARVMTMV